MVVWCFTVENVEFTTAQMQTTTQYICNNIIKSVKR
jgi:hypothetical protein